jgi:hypothetical protein
MVVAARIVFLVAALGLTLGARPAAAAKRLAVVHDRAVGPVAVDRRYVVWATGSLEGEAATALVQRARRGGRTRVLARGIVPQYGVATVPRSVVYARPGVAGTTVLVEARHDGSHVRKLSRPLLAPMDVRGSRIAWAEARGSRQRVVVRNLRTGRTWVAAVLPRCRRHVCYRIDAVALARQGVVFSRGAVGPHVSYVFRRRFRDAHAAAVAVAGDPQPDVVPSSAGALYYALGRGWYRWDFGHKKPRATRYMGARQDPVLRYERGRWVMLTQSGCNYGLVMRTDSGRATVVATPAGVRAVVGEGADACTQLTAVALRGATLVTAWAVTPEAENAEHSDEELISAVLSGWRV